LRSEPQKPTPERLPCRWQDCLIQLQAEEFGDPSQEADRLTPRALLRRRAEQADPADRTFRTRLF
jgi:hypothetical protein